MQPSLRTRLLASLFLAATLLVSSCATLSPGLGVAKTESAALASPETTTLGKRFAARAKEHPGMSGFRLLVDGADSFALRLQITEKAEKTLDVQYFVLQQDDTGQLLLGALLDAADRGIRVRILLDDALGIDGGATLRPLAAHPNIEIRIFNPFLARHEFAFLRGLEYLLQVGKLDYRMHNKLFVGDNAIAVTGGRNIGDEYFQASGEREFGDFDLAVAGPMVKNLSRTFDLFWNDRLAIPVETQPFGERSTGDLAKARAALAEHRQKMVATSVYYSEISRRSAGRTFCPESVRSSGPRRYSRTTVRTRLPSNRPPDRGALRRHHEPGKQLPGRPGPGKRAGLSRGPMARFGERRLGEPRHGAGREAAEAKLDRDLVAASAGRTAVASALPSLPRQAARRVAWPARSRAAEAHAAPLRRSPRPC